MHVCIVTLHIYYCLSVFICLNKIGSPDSHFDYIMSSLEVPKSKEIPGISGAMVTQVRDLLPHLGEGFIEVTTT